MTLRYGAVLKSLRSLRGEPAIAEVRPTEAAIRYHDRAHDRRAIAPLADVYVPPNATGASALVVHGGGFVLGSRRMKPMRYLAARLYAAGISVCVFDYRMIFRGGRLSEAIDDVHDAFEFWSAKTAQLALDPSAITLVGLSAGATLALLAASRIEPSRLAGLACCFGLYEVDHLHGVATLLPRMLFGTADRAAWNQRSPRYAPQPAVPTLLLHGTDDGLVPVDQARRLAAYRESLGLATRLVIYDGAPHGFFNVPVPAADAGAHEIIELINASH
ncbi:MAG: alpha/beta hydrolase [Deltaproteobacteria bacterium]